MTADNFSIACIGGGPGGLFAAITLATRLPGSRIDVFERNRADDVFGFGVVFSDATLDNIDAVDPVLRDTLAAHGTHWDRIDVRAHGQSHSAGGNGMAAVHRRVLLDALRSRATELGARIHYGTTIDVDTLGERGDYDLIVAADGANSATRERYVDSLDHSVESASVKFIWFGTTFQFEGLTFLHRRSVHGNFAVHAYPIGSGLSTFIVETDEQTWRAAGLDEFDTSAPPGRSDEKTQRYLEELFAADIDGHRLVANNSRWANFRTRRTRRWHARTASNTPVVLIGDAVHTAHFSVGSGTKMAMEDAAALADSVAAHPGDLDAAIVDFEAIRHPRVARIQDSSVPSLSWWDHFGEYYRALSPSQFSFHFFSRAISAEKIRHRDPQFVADVESDWRAEHGRDPLDTPLPLGDTVFRHRLLTTTDVADGRLVLCDGVAELTATTDPSPEPGRVVDAPASDVITLSAVDRRRLDEIAASGPAVVAVRRGTPLTRALSSEYLRFQHRIPTVIVDSTESIRARRAVDERDNAATVVLAGRADALAYESEAGR